jgi:hypothetical protein
MAAERAQALQTTRRCWGIFDWLCKLLVIVFGRRKGGDPCVYIPDRIIHKPDPCIYSQFYLMQLGQPVTWENPDVALFLGGVKQYTYDLTVDTEYDVRVTVHNASPDKLAPSTRVEVRWVEFGAGGQVRTPIDTLLTDVPVYPGTSMVGTKWRTPATPGHYCIEVEVFHPDDGNIANNRGWNNTQVKTATSAVRTPVRIYNQALPYRTAAARLRDLEPTGGREVPPELVRVMVDSYTFHDAYGKKVEPARMFAQRPPAWPAQVEPATFHFAENEAYRDVLLVVEAPDTAGMREAFNVSAWQGMRPIGGVTVTVTT